MNRVSATPFQIFPHSSYARRFIPPLALAFDNANNPMDDSTSQDTVIPLLEQTLALQSVAVSAGLIKNKPPLLISKEIIEYLIDLQEDFEGESVSTPKKCKLIHKTYKHLKTLKDGKDLALLTDFRNRNALCLMVACRLTGLSTNKNKKRNIQAIKEANQCIEIMFKYALSPASLSLSLT